MSELRGHLKVVYVAELEKGQSEDDAEQAAIVQFGTPNKVGAETTMACILLEDSSSRAEFSGEPLE